MSRRRDRSSVARQIDQREPARFRQLRHDPVEGRPVGQQGMQQDEIAARAVCSTSSLAPSTVTMAMEGALK